MLDGETIFEKQKPYNLRILLQSMELLFLEEIRAVRFFARQADTTFISRRHT